MAAPEWPLPAFDARHGVPHPDNQNFEIIEIQAPRSLLLGSNSALFEGQSLSDVYYSDFWQPPLYPEYGHLRVHAACPSLSDFFFTLQSNPEGGNQHMQRMLDNENPLEWTFNENAVANGMLSLADLGPQPQPFFLELDGGDEPAPAMYPVQETWSVLGNQHVLGYEFSWRNRGGYRHTAPPGGGDRVQPFIYHPHKRRDNHQAPPPIDVNLRPGALALKDDKRPRPRALLDVKIGTQLQSFRQSGTLDEGGD